MGKILSLLHKGNVENCCSQKQREIFLDFENAQPSNDETQIYNEIEIFLKDSETILKDIKSYKGKNSRKAMLTFINSELVISAAAAEIREVITKPSPETESKAWDTIVPNMFKLKKLFEFSKKINQLVPMIFLKLCSPGVA